MHNLSKVNLENNMHAAISNCNKSQSGLFSRCVFSNINGTLHHSILKLISAINNLVNDNSEKTKPLIVYNANGHPICLNNWEDKHYFTGVFLTLFLFGDSKHLAKHKTAISL